MPARWPMTLAPPSQPVLSSQRNLLAVAGGVSFCIPVLMALGDFARWVPWLNQALVLVLLILYGVCLALFHPKLIPEIWLFIVFVIWSGISGLLVADNQYEFGVMFGRVARACGLAIAVAGLCQLKRSATINFVAVLVVALGLAAYSWQAGIYAMGFDPSSNGDETPWNPNTFGVVMLTGVFALAHLWGVPRLRFLRPVIPFLVLALAFSLLSSASRKSFLSLLTFGLLWLWFCYLRQRLRSPLALLMAACILGGGYILTNYALENSRLGLRLGNTGEDSGDQSRLSMYEALPVLLKQNPIAGVGLGNFGVRAHAITGSYAYSHSDYVEVFATTGLIGGLLYFPLYFIWWRRLARISKITEHPEVRYHVQVFQAILVTMILLAFGIPHFMQTEQWYWMAAMMGCSHAWAAGLVTTGGPALLRSGRVPSIRRAYWRLSPRVASKRRYGGASES